jgi:hypothetical protein
MTGNQYGQAGKSIREGVRRKRNNAIFYSRMPQPLDARMSAGNILGITKV